MKTVLFICTGNTCRSPIAEGLFNKQAKEKEIDWRAVSCGLSASIGQPASKNAVLVLKEYGIDLSGHRSSQVNEQMLQNVDMILCATRRHMDLLAASFPSMKYKMAVLGEEIPDPYGGEIEIYSKTAEIIQKAIDNLIRGINDGI